MSKQVTAASGGVGGTTAGGTVPTPAPAAAAAAKLASRTRRPGEFSLTLADGQRRNFRVTPRAAARFEKLSGKLFSELSVLSVSDLGDFLEAAEVRAGRDGFIPGLWISELHLLGRHAVDLLPLAARELLRVQYVVLAALCEVRGKALPDSLVEEVRRELGELPELHPQMNADEAAAPGA